MQQGLSGKASQEVGNADLSHLAASRVSGAAQVGSDDHVRQLQHAMVSREWFGIGDIQSGGRDLPGLECCGERFGVDDSSSSDVD